MTERSLDASKRLHERATEIYPGGVSHNVRYEPPHPIYARGTDGATIEDADGNTYVDFWNNHHASVLGHGHPSVVEAVQSQAAKGLHYGLPTELAIDLGRTVQSFVPSAERLRFCASGTEATMYAVRLARAWTDRDTILKVEGGWHGGNTDLASKVYAPFEEPTSAGLPPGAEAHVEAFPLNDEERVKAILDANRGDVAAVILDPRKAGIEPEEAFLDMLVDECEDRGILLIFDEVVTGFRVAPGSYQARVDVEPDLTALGKTVGGGLPVGALAGRADVFDAARPDVDVPPDERVIAGGGTFAGNPMTLAAGLATLEVIEDEPVHDHTEQLAERLRTGVTAVFEDRGLGAEMLGLSSLVRPAFGVDRPLRTPRDVIEGTDTQRLKEYHVALGDRGYFFLPGHMGNLTYQHTKAHVDGVVEATREIL